MKRDELELAGSAWTWGLETVQAFDWNDLVDAHCVTVRTELPYDNNHKPLPRRGNRYYPTMLDVETGIYRNGEEVSLTLLIEDARSLAAALTKAADLAEQIDSKDIDACGHWWPCWSCKEG